MKKMKITQSLLILSILGISFSSYAQYVPTLREGCEWYTYSWFEISYNTTFQILGDSTINDTTYKKIISFPTGVTPLHFNTDLVREDTNSKKIYRRANDIDYLMYDFSLQLGDTFTIQRMDGGFLHNLVLDSITGNLYNKTGNFLQTDIENMRVYYFHDPEFAFIDNVIWIEGLGSLAGLIYSDQSWNGGNNGETLLCHYDENSFRDFHYIYYDEPNPCESIVGINNSEILKRVKIFPNPSIDGFCRIEGRDIKSIEIYNSSGSMISGSNFSITDIAEINLSKSPGGVYFIRIMFNDSNSSVIKVIKI